MSLPGSEYYVCREYIDALMRSGHKRLLDWYSGGEPVKDVYERIGMHIGYDEAESILIKYRKNGVGPQEVQNILELGEIQL